jgi:peptide/nickel transport system ATP-binding protein
VRAVDGVSFTLEQGGVLGIVGESGSGKSTLARLVMALGTPTSGEVLLEGQSLQALPAAALRRRRRDFQMVFQDPYGSLDPRHTVGRIVAEPLHLDHRLGHQDREAIAADALQSVGLKPADAARYPHEFSGGQRQRIAIARALITGPKLLVADEAVSALDLTVQAQILRLLMRLKAEKGLTILFISHNLGVIEDISDRVGVMYAGRLIELGPTAEVLHRPQQKYTRTLLEAEPTLDIIGRRHRRASADHKG